jgi:hypothetical protein
MNSQDIYNLHEAYIGVYADLDEERAPGVKPYEPRKRRPLDPEKPLSGEKGDGSGYGADEKFKKPDDKIEKPGTTVPAPKKGGYGRIFSNIPYGIGAHGNRNRSRNSTIRGMDPGAPRSEKLRKLSPEEKQTTKKKPSREIVRNQTKKEDFELWVSELLDEGYDLSGYTWEGLYEEYIQNEAYDIYDVILSHLINEGYADSYEAAEVIMVNMSEDWRESILEEVEQLDEISQGLANAVVGKRRKQWNREMGRSDWSPTAQLARVNAKGKKLNDTMSSREARIGKPQPRVDTY